MRRNGSPGHPSPDPSPSQASSEEADQLLGQRGLLRAGSGRLLRGLPSPRASRDLEASAREDGASARQDGAERPATLSAAQLRAATARVVSLCAFALFCVFGCALLFSEARPAPLR